MALDKLQTFLESANKEANLLRASADRLDIRGEHASALLFRNAAWRIENGREWLDDTQVKENANV